ncbi:hypothetical protein nbrc107696_18950 [Gordonia spumicola]|uniref:Uncharacterized protein n=1 Tax=Gordonia spumicola TaxID=589161 RepID=A0A7I9V7Y4_9ACTN|nr:hypothetical protein [Gordonia spumicola]GEE01449.1 hypothetical protein nbrc107696_18950 [Gordonia spumicola]
MTELMSLDERLMLAEERVETLWELKALAGRVGERMIAAASGGRRVYVAEAERVFYELEDSPEVAALLCADDAPNRARPAEPVHDGP